MICDHAKPECLEVKAPYKTPCRHATSHKENVGCGGKCTRFADIWVETMTCDECDQKSTCSTYKNQFESGYYLVNEYRKVEKKEKVGKLTKTVVVDELVPVGKVNASLKTHSGHCPIYKSHIKFVKHVEEK